MFSITIAKKTALTGCVLVEERLSNVACDKATAIELSARMLRADSNSDTDVVISSDDRISVTDSDIDDMLSMI